MEQEKIEQLLLEAKFSDALDSIQTRSPSTWRDTAELRCFHALKLERQAIQLAKRLYRGKLGSRDPRLDDPEIFEQLTIIALVFSDQGEADKARNLFRHLCGKEPKSAKLRRYYAQSLTRNGLLDAAELELGNAQKLDMCNTDTYNQLANIYSQTGRVRRSINHRYRAATLVPNQVNDLQKLANSTNYCQDSSQQDQYQLAKLWADTANQNIEPNSPPIVRWSTNRKLKIGFVLASINSHSLSRYVLPLLRDLDRSKFGIIAYSDAPKINSVSAKLSKLCDSWQDSLRLDDQQLVAQIQSDQIDILIDLSGHSENNRLGVFAFCPAFLQLSWLGYPSTTGLTAIGFRITDWFCDPENVSDRFFSEKLIRLPGSYISYLPSSTTPDIEEKKESNVTAFGYFGPLSKISDLSIDAWSAAMHAVPNSELYLKRRELSNQSAIYNIYSQFKHRGIDSNRLHLGTEFIDHEQHLSHYHVIDIALDTTPYNAVTTALDALWMGVPVVSLMKDTHASRRCASVLHALGLGTLSVNNISDFVLQVRNLAGNAQRRKQLRLSLRELIQESDLADSKKFAKEFCDALVSQWQEKQSMARVKDGNKNKVEGQGVLGAPQKKIGEAVFADPGSDNNG